MPWTPPHPSHLKKDIEKVRRVLGTAPGLEAFTVQDVYRYYSLTTGRDYRILEWFMGNGLHTVLDAGPPIGSQGRGTRQACLVLKWMDACARARVLEVGCGRGYCTLFLAGATSNQVHYHAIDLLDEHIASAEEDNFHGSRAQFHVGDVCQWEPPSGLKFDMVFGCESMCHLSPEAFVGHVKNMMNPGAKLVIIDGFRGRLFDRCDEMYRTAMKLAEAGFRINAMPSKADWKAACDKNGFHLLEDVDLTEEAIPFWSMGYSLASIPLSWPWLLRLYTGSSLKRKESVSNLIASSMVGHALVGGAAEYGMLVFEFTSSKN